MARTLSIRKRTRDQENKRENRRTRDQENKRTRERDQKNKIPRERIREQETKHSRWNCSTQILSKVCNAERTLFSRPALIVIFESLLQVFSSMLLREVVKTTAPSYGDPLNDQIHLLTDSREPLHQLKRINHHHSLLFSDLFYRCVLFPVCLWMSSLISVSFAINPSNSQTYCHMRFENASIQALKCYVSTQ